VQIQLSYTYDLNKIKNQIKITRTLLCVIFKPLKCTADRLNHSSKQLMDVGDVDVHTTLHCIVHCDSRAVAQRCVWKMGMLWQSEGGDLILSYYWHRHSMRPISGDIASSFSCTPRTGNGAGHCTKVHIKLQYHRRIISRDSRSRPDVLCRQLRVMGADMRFLSLQYNNWHSSNAPPHVDGRTYHHEPPAGAGKPRFLPRSMQWRGNL